MKKLTTKWFRKWSRKANLSNEILIKSISDLENGISTTDLGSHLFKLRVKRKGGGKRSGFRTIVVFKKVIELFFSMDSERMKEKTLIKTN